MLRDIKETKINKIIFFLFRYTDKKEINTIFYRILRVKLYPSFFIYFNFL